MDQKNKNISYEPPINLVAIFKILWDSKLKIIFVTLIFAVSSVFYSLGIQNTYTSSSLIKLTEADSNQLSGMASQFGGLASLAGVSMPNAGNDKSRYVMETLRSRDFLRHLLEFDGVKESLVAAKKYDKITKKIIFDEDLFDSKTRQWKKRNNSVNVIPSYLEIYEEIYKDTFKVSHDIQSGFISVSFEHISPVFAQSFLSLSLEELNNVTKELDLEKSSRALVYLEEQLLIKREKDIKNSLQSLIFAELQTKMLANVSDNYLIETISKPFIPEIKSGPFRAIICILITSFGGMLACLFFLIRQFIFERNELYPTIQ
jgi:LPS O-antigen subunit length determinant protein (WzzB/FepE family)